MRSNISIFLFFILEGNYAHIQNTRRRARCHSIAHPDAADRAGSSRSARHDQAPGRCLQHHRRHPVCRSCLRCAAAAERKGAARAYGRTRDAEAAHSAPLGNHGGAPAAGCNRLLSAALSRHICARGYARR